MAVIFILSAVLTNFMSNTAATALLVPIGLQLAQSMGADPKAVLMATVIGASCAYATPIGMPANTMVYNIGGYSFMDYVKVGGSSHCDSDNRVINYFANILSLLPII